jgi:uncharacterized protein (TIGR03437 family)
MAYDSKHNQVVLFGGGSPFLNDTWVWDGSTWAQKFPETSPPPRYHMALAYDAAHGEVVLFGGSGHIGYYNDTWVWDGSNWTQKFPNQSPPGRFESSMTYDARHRQIVLFGGAGAPDQNLLNDTWVWDGSTWTEELPEDQPVVRRLHALTYDSVHEQVVLFGGLGLQDYPYQFNDTWVWTGSNWTQEFPQTNPGVRDSFAMVFDSAHDQVVLFGGDAIIGAVGDTWTWGSPAIANPPIISGVVSATAFGGFASVAPGSWIEIYGSNFTTDIRGWSRADFTGNNAPTMLGGVKVNFGGQAAFVDYVSPGQVDVQLPSNIANDTLQLTLTNANGTSAPASLNVKAAEPGLLAPVSFKIGANQYVVAQFVDGTYVLPTGAIAGVTSRPAKPGDTIIIYGVGFGAVTPNIQAGEIVTEQNQLSQTFEMEFGTAQAQMPYFGLAPNLVGVYQFNVVVPEVLDNDLVPLTFKLGGVAGTQTLFTAVHH